MYKCDICGRKIHKKNRAYGYTLCSKHMHQYLKYNKFLDNNPRTENDLNEFRFLDNKTVEFDVYNKKQEVVNHFLIDKDDLNKIRYHKWRIDGNKRVITGNSTNKNPRRELSRFILGITDSSLVVDHVNGNSLDNRKQNLRICTQRENVFNKCKNNSQSGYLGVFWDKSRFRWAPEITQDSVRVHLGRYKELEKAVYARYIAEIVLFGDYRNKNDDFKKIQLFKSISPNDKKQIKKYIINKLTDKEMLQEHKLCA